jgi:Uma2 family endonuclease
LPDDERWDLLDGLSSRQERPESERHQLLVAAIATGLFEPARRLGCYVLPGFTVVSAASDADAAYADVVIRCGEPLGEPYAKDPVLIAEVLSPSTMANDRGRKLEFYKSIASLQSLLIVYQDERRVESWTRSGEKWRYAVAQGAAASVDLPAFEAILPLADLYEDVLLP